GRQESLATWRSLDVKRLAVQASYGVRLPPPLLDCLAAPRLTLKLAVPGKHEARPAGGVFCAEHWSTRFSWHACTGGPPCPARSRCPKLTVLALRPLVSVGLNAELARRVPDRVRPIRAYLCSAHHAKIGLCYLSTYFLHMKY